MQNDQGASSVMTFEKLQRLLETASLFKLNEPAPEARAGTEPSAALRLKRCFGLECRPVRLSEHGASAMGAEGMEALLVLLPGSAFELAFDADRLPPSFEFHLMELARILGRHGGSVRVYMMDRFAPPSLPGVEWVSVRDELRPLVQQPLLALARQSLTGWTDAHEQRFVEGRAKLSAGQILPVAEALARASTSSRFVLLLGDFGTGKSTHLARRAALMASAHLEAPERFAAPVLLRLGGMRPDLAAIFEKHVQDLSFEAFRLAVDLEMAVPLLDGLDELEVPPQAIDGTLTALLGSFSPSRARALLSSRKTLFSSAGRMQEVLREVDSLGLVELQDMERAEVIEFVGKRTRSAQEAASVLENLQRVQDLNHLSQRPVLLDLIVENRDRLSGQGMTTTRLYAVTVDEWLERRHDEAPSALREQRLVFARTLARTLFETRAQSAPYEELVRFAREVLGDASVPADPAVLELHDAVFLAHDAMGARFRFAHRSFLEYFLALDISERLEAGRADALDLPRLTPEIVSFLAGLPGWERTKEALRRVLTQPYHRRGSENALLALYLSTRASVGVGEALGRALQREFPANAQLAGASLASIELPWISLPGADLSGARLLSTRLDCADLRGARLDRARASHTVFDGALLDGVSFLEADLFSASFVDASITGVRWEGAELEGTIDLREEPARAPRASTPDEAPRPVFRSRMSGVSTTLWSPDGLRLASISRDGAVRLWDARSGTLLHAFHERPSSWPLAMAFSPDGRHFATSSTDKWIRLWNTRSGTLLRTFEEPAASWDTLVFSPDGRLLASATDSGKACLWEVHSGTCLQSFETPEYHGCAVAFSPDDGTLTFASNRGLILRWDVRSGAPSGPLDSQRAGEFLVTFSRDGGVLAFASTTSAIELWDARSDVPLLTARSHRYRGPSMTLSPDGGLLAYATALGKVRLWDVRARTLRHTLQAYERGDMTVALSADGELLASGSEGGMLGLWNVRSGERLHSFAGHSDRLNTLAFSPDGALLASVSDDDTIHVWDVHTGSLLHRPKDRLEPLEPLAFSPDGGLLASTTNQGTVHVWDAHSGAQLHALALKTKHLSLVRTAEGILVASAAKNSPIRLWNAGTGRALPSLESHPLASGSLVFSRDGQLLAAALADRTLGLWEVRSGALLHILKVPSSQSGAMCFSRDGTLLATSSEDGGLCLWKSRSGTLLHRLDGHTTAVGALAFSPDDGILASASSEGRIHLWEPHTGEHLHTDFMPVAHPMYGDQVSTLISLGFSPDGGVLTAVAHNGSTCSWDVRTHTLLFSEPGQATASALLAPDGQVRASALWAGMHLRVLHGSRGSVLLSVVEDSWAASVQGTPFFIGGGELSRILHFASGDRAMPASLWAPLFQRPELVRATLAGEAPDLTTLGLDTYAACEAALITARTHRGLVRRRPVS
jgi:WD40 repeat protein